MYCKSMYDTVAYESFSYHCIIFKNAIRVGWGLRGGVGAERGGRLGRWGVGWGGGV